MADKSVCLGCGRRIASSGGAWYTNAGSETSCKSNKEGHTPVHQLFGPGLSSTHSLSLNQFGTEVLHRGMDEAKVSKPLGVHWSTRGGDISDNRGARMFANPSEGSKSTIVHGRVNRNAIVTPGTREHTKMSGERGIWGEDSPEAEKTIRPGATVAVHRVTRIRNVKGKEKQREITYRPPRQVQA